MNLCEVIYNKMCDDFKNYPYNEVVTINYNITYGDIGDDVNRDMYTVTALLKKDGYFSYKPYPNKGFSWIFNLDMLDKIKERSAAPNPPDNSRVIPFLNYLRKVKINEYIDKL